MCGIAGILGGGGQDAIEKATDCLQHRGPSEKGYWISTDGKVALGHRRLSIIDLSPAASQPMLYEGRYRIIHNGELYNYIELKESLQKKGYRFHNHSDTEVILAAFDAYGKECLQHFDGMFAFAIWDEKEKELFAARDRFGEKPFFFSYDGERLLFASELKALWQAGVEKKPNAAMVYNFLTIGYTSNPRNPQETFFEGVQKLPAASFLSYSMEKKEVRIEQYWALDGTTAAITETEAIEKFQSLFSESTARRMRSDVAVGTSLSGGLDSAAVVAFCDGMHGTQYSHKCFTATFPGFEKDELPYARMVAGQYGLEHFIVDINEAGIPLLMETVMRQQEEPFSSASVLAQYKVYEKAKQEGVTVLLDGQGADEVLAGYHRYYKWYWQELYRRGQLGKSGEFHKAKANGVQENFSLANKLASMMPQFAAGLLESRRSKEAFRHPHLHPDFAFANKRNLYYTMPPRFDLNGALYFNTSVNGLEELLRLADRNSMAHAVEVRLPFLSHRLVEFIFSLPPELKIHNGWTKWLLRRSVETMLPEEVVWRKDKTGFEPPQKQWMQNPSVQQAIMEGKKVLADAGILRQEAVKKVEPHSAYAARNHDWKYWSASFLFG